jgi:hypothetical protein
MIYFYLGIAVRCPFLDRSTSQVPAANSSDTFLHIRPACGHMPNIKLSGFNPSHVSFHVSPFHCLPPLMPYVVAWLLPLPGMCCPSAACPLVAATHVMQAVQPALPFLLPGLARCAGPGHFFLYASCPCVDARVRSTIFSSLVRVVPVCGSSIDGLRPACIQQK